MVRGETRTFIDKISH